mgnify:CR=1 FL=1
MTTTTMRARSRSWFWGGEEPEWIVVALVVVSLLAGAALMIAFRGQVMGLEVDGIALTYPADWSAVGMGAADDDRSLVRLGQMGGRASLAISVLRELDPANPVSMDALVAQRGFGRAQREAMYRVLSTTPAELNGKRGVAVSYAYVADPKATAYQSALPVVMEGVDYIVPHAGKAYVLTLEAPSASYAEYETAFRRIVASVRF